MIYNSKDLFDDISKEVVKRIKNKTFNQIIQMGSSNMGLSQSLTASGMLERQIREKERIALTNPKRHKIKEGCCSS